MNTTVGSWNCKVGTDLTLAARNLRTVLAPCDILGLQEWGGRHREDILDQLDGYDYAKPHARSGPVVWDAGRYRLTHARDVIAAKGRRVGRIPGLRAVLEDYHVTVVTLRDTTDERRGHRITVINCHAPVWRPGARATMHREYVEAVTKMHRHFVAKGHTVYTLGDWNRTPRQVRQPFAEVAGAMSCWAGRKEKPTHGRRTIDAIWNRCRPTDVRTIRTASDHRAVIAEY